MAPFQCLRTASCSESDITHLHAYATHFCMVMETHLQPCPRHHCRRQDTGMQQLSDSRQETPGCHYLVQLNLHPPLQTAMQASCVCACFCRADFKEIRLLGTGNFSKVYLAQHRLDGVSYAVKRSIRPVYSDAVKRQWVQVQTTCACLIALHAPHNTRRHAVRCNFNMPLENCC